MNSYVKVKVEGKNVNNYIKWLIKNKIDIINLNIVKHNELEIIVSINDYDKLSKYSKTYKVTIIKKYGKLRLFDIVEKNIIILICLILSIIFLFLLSNIIFSVDVIYNDQEVVKLVTKELAKYNIKRFQKKKNFDYLNRVKEKILTDNKDNLEWLEIEESGTKYIVKVVERKKENKQVEYEYQSIIAKKEATITNIKALSGEKTKGINEYVRKGEVVISGILTKPDGTVLYTRAKGEIYGEVWYQMKIEYPLYYQEERVTGKNRNVLSFYFLNNKFSLFEYKKYKQFKVTSKTLLSSNFIPFKIAKERLYEVIIKEEIYTPEAAIQRAIDYGIIKMKENNHNIIGVKEIQVLSKENKNSKIVLNVFVSVIENITEIAPIIPEITENIE